MVHDLRTYRAQQQRRKSSATAATDHHKFRGLSVFEEDTHRVAFYGDRGYVDGAAADPLNGMSNSLPQLFFGVFLDVRGREQEDRRLAVHSQGHLPHGDDPKADEGLLQHILTNLLGNSIKYSPPDHPVEFRVARRGLDAEFVIRDRGCGIPEADQAQLFTAFYRGSNVAQKPGSGLGLVIVKRCVDLHGGTIRCASEEGVGTTFTVTLPLFDGTRIFHRRVGRNGHPAALSTAR